MNIPEKPSACKSISPKPFKSIDIGAGNIVPNWMYKKILTSGGKSDTMAIALLSDLWFLYRSTGQEEHQKDYDYFCNKFNLSRYQVREAFIRLEALGLMKRSVGTIIVQGRKIANILFVTLNVKKLLEITPSYLRPESDDDGNNNDQNQESIFFRNRVGDAKNKDSKILDGRIVKNNLKENRSTKSNFCKNSPLEEKPIQTTALFPVTGFSLASFYPLDQSDIDKLQMLCGREFSSNAINEILQSLSTKLLNHNFLHKAVLIKYMSKALTYEMRDAVKISNESFKIKSNITAEKIITQAREEFLNKIENNIDTSFSSIIVRKLAGLLEPSIAYKLLSGASFPRNNIPTYTDNNVLKIKLHKKIELNSSQYDAILAQVKAVYGNHINSLKLKLKSITFPNSSYQKNNLSLETKAKTIAPRMFKGVWGRVRQALTETYGEVTDRNWFSKLEVFKDKSELRLKAPTSFVRDWISQNYQDLIEKICTRENYQLAVVTL